MEDKVETIGALKKGNTTSDFPDPGGVESQITPIQKEILAIAHRMMLHHYVLDTDNLYKECKRSMITAGTATIRTALQDLLNKRYLIDGKAVSREQLLDNENRRRIRDLVRRDPGIHFTLIKDTIDIDSRTIQWHLGMLVDFNFIREVRFGVNVVYFDYLLGSEHDLFYYFLHKGDTPAIFQAILETPGITFAALLDRLQIPRSTLSRKIKGLFEQGLLIGETITSQSMALQIRGDCIPILRAYFSSR